MKRFSAILAATIFAFTLSGCGDGGTAGAPEHASPGVLISGGGSSPTPTPTPTPTPEPTVDPTVDTNVKKIYYSTNGSITDVCINGDNIYFPVIAGQNSKIVNCDLSKNTQKDLIKGITKPFSVAYNNNCLYYATREGNSGHIWKYDLNKGGSPKSFQPGTSTTKLLDPTYMRNLAGSIVGLDFSSQSRSAYVLYDTENKYITTPSSTVISQANFFNMYPFTDGKTRFLVTGSLSALGGIAVYRPTDTGFQEVKSVSSEYPIASGETTGRFVTAISDTIDLNTLESKVIYSSFEDTMNIYVYNPSGTDTKFVSNGAVPPVYDMVYSLRSNKYYFTACSTNGSQGVYKMSATGKNIQRIASSSTENTMLGPARIILSGRNVGDGYEEIIWTCGGGSFDTAKGEFTNSANGAVYSKIEPIN